MSINAKSTIEFSSTQVAEILAQYVIKNFPHCKNVKAENVKFSVSAGHDDRMSYSSPSLIGAKVEVMVTAVDTSDH